MSGQPSHILKQRVTFRCGSLELEGILHTLNQPEPTPAVIVCHPHPLYGGSMHNNVVIAVCEELLAKGVSALRFNFRGVERSQGRHGEGIAEIEDVIAAITYVTSLPNSEAGKIGVAGYSFGAHVGLRAAVGDDRVGAVVGISPALAVQDFSFLRGYERPKLLLAGVNDEFIPQGELAKLFEELPGPKQLEIVPYADHFWLGFERRVATKVAGFFEGLFAGNK